LPFNAASLTALVQGNNFTFWHYRTSDSRATASTPGYFAPVASSVKQGDLLILHTSDAVALTVFRTGAVIGTGETLDGEGGPFNTVRTVAHAFSILQAAVAVVRTIVLSPLATAIVAGTPLPVSATVTGPVAQVVFTLRDANDAVIPPQRVVNVVGGSASTSFTAPPIGSGYTIRVEDTADPAVGVTSPSFSVGNDLALLLQENGSRLLIEPLSLRGALRQ
jgi:hypothetical protein